MKFVVDTDPYAAWDPEPAETNLEFLKNVDPEFFQHVAEAHTDSLQAAESQAAQALRLFYGHAVETVVALLFAAVQSPHYVPGWIHLYQMRHLRSLVAKLNAEEEILSVYTIPRFSWRLISDIIHQGFVLEDKERESAVKAGFADFWQFLGSQLLNDVNTEEYNSLKHGLRARSGGLVLRAGRETTPGVPAADSNTHTLVAGLYGSSFLEFEIAMDRRNLSLARTSTNWDVEALARTLVLCSMSLQNILSYLRLVAGAKAETPQFYSPKDLTWFGSVMHGAPGSSVWRLQLNPAQGEAAVSAADILAAYKHSDNDGEA